MAALARPEVLPPPRNWAEVSRASQALVGHLAESESNHWFPLKGDQQSPREVDLGGNFFRNFAD